MLALLLLPVLVSGFIVLSINPKNKLNLFRYEGQQLYLKALKIGTRYFIIISIITFAKHIYFPDLDFVYHVIEKSLTGVQPDDSIRGWDIVDVSWLLTLSFTTIIAAYVISLSKCLQVIVRNMVTMRFFGSNQTALMAIVGRMLNDSPIDNMLFDSFVNNQAIMVTLRSRKVYIGMVNGLGEPSGLEEPNQEISIVPVISGYRDKETLSLKLTNDYDVMNHHGDDFSVIIKVDQIETVSWFNYDFYLDTNGNIESEPPGNDTPDPDSRCSECQSRTKVKVGRYSVIKDFVPPPAE